MSATLSAHESADLLYFRFLAMEGSVSAIGRYPISRRSGDTGEYIAGSSLWMRVLYLVINIY